MFIGAIIAWISRALVFVVVGKVAGAFFASRSGIQIVLIFIGINLALSSTILVSFKRWQRSILLSMQESSRFGTARWANPVELSDLESLIEVPDPDLYAALSSDALLAPEYRTALFDRIKSFQPGREA